MRSLFPMRQRPVSRLSNKRQALTETKISLSRQPIGTMLRNARDLPRLSRRN